MYAVVVVAVPHQETEATVVLEVVLLAVLEDPVAVLMVHQAEKVAME